MRVFRRPLGDLAACGCRMQAASAALEPPGGTAARAAAASLPHCAPCFARPAGYARLSPLCPQRCGAEQCARGTRANPGALGSKSPGVKREQGEGARRVPRRAQRFINNTEVTGPPLQYIFQLNAINWSASWHVPRVWFLCVKDGTHLVHSSICASSSALLQKKPPPPRLSFKPPPFPHQHSISRPKLQNLKTQIWKDSPIYPEEFTKIHPVMLIFKAPLFIPLLGECFQSLGA